MSLKNLRKNTQLIKYLQKLKAKKLADTQNFAAPESSAKMEVKQPCMVGELEKWQFQTRCAPGWQSVNTAIGAANTEERKPICERKKPTAKLPKCRNVDKEVLKENIDLLQALQNDFMSSLTNYKKNFYLEDSKMKLKRLSKLENLTPEQQKAKAKAEYLAYKYSQTIPEIDEDAISKEMKNLENKKLKQQPKKRKGSGFYPSNPYPVMDEITLESAVSTGKEYLDWITKKTKLSDDLFDHERDIIISEKIRKDLASRGNKVLKEKGKKSSDYLKFDMGEYYPSKFENLTKIQQSFVKKSAENILKTYGGLLHFEEIDVLRDTSDDRAYAITHNVSRKHINLGRNITDSRLVIKGSFEDGMNNLTRAIAHEIGHVFESQSSGIKKASENFVLSRSFSDKPKKLSEITGISSYEPHEVAYEGPFIDPYVGKLYYTPSGEIRGSEVISLGLEKIFSAQSGISREFAKDPMHLHFTLGVLLTSYNQQSKDDNYSESELDKSKLIKFYKTLRKSKNMI